MFFLSIYYAIVMNLPSLQAQQRDPGQQQALMQQPSFFTLAYILLVPDSFTHCRRFPFPEISSYINRIITISNVKNIYIAITLKKKKTSINMRYKHKIIFKLYNAFFCHVETFSQTLIFVLLLFP